MHIYSLCRNSFTTFLPCSAFTARSSTHQTRFPARVQLHHRQCSVAAGRSPESMEGNQQSASQQPLKPVDPITKRYDDMEESYGEGYASFSIDEGFGGVYSSPLTVKPVDGDKSKAKGASHARDDEDIDAGKEPTPQEFDRTQGSPVAEKERSSRHGVGFTGAHPS